MLLWTEEIICISGLINYLINNLLKEICFNPNPVFIETFIMIVAMSHLLLSYYAHCRPGHSSQPGLSLVCGGSEITVNYYKLPRKKVKLASTEPLRPPTHSPL